MKMAVRAMSKCHLLIALMMEAARTSETLVNFYQTTRHYNPEDSHLDPLPVITTRRLCELLGWEKNYYLYMQDPEIPYHDRYLACYHHILHAQSTKW
jgi:hypothetical protein